MRRILGRIALALGAAFALGCTQGGDDDVILLREGEADTEASAYWSAEPELTTEEIESGRLDDEWRAAASIDSFNRAWEESVGVRLDALARPDTLPRARGTLADTTRLALADTFRVLLPLAGDVPGPSVMIVQTMLDRADFSPGIIDGKWGKNTEKAVYWLQRREGLAPTGQVDSTTFRRIVELAGRPDRYVIDVALSEEDVSGPFVEIPESPYAQAELECMCYTSLSEKLGERFHSAPELLAELNPDVALDSLAAGDSLRVPNLEAPDALGGAGPVARIVISGQGYYVHAVDGSGRIVHHFPSTLGSRYDPSPRGEFRITSVTRDPWFHYQPALLEDDPSKPAARIPPGPNSPVGVVWIQLSKEHYGIHGTARPATIGYVTSHGCVRLTNWDAARLAERVQPGVPVLFRDVGEPAVARR